MSYGSPASRRRGAVRHGARTSNTVWLPITAAAGVLLLLMWYAMSQDPGPDKPTAAHPVTGAGGGRAAGGTAPAAALPTVPPPPQSGCTTGQSLPAGVTTRTLRVAGVDRTYVLAVPTGGGTAARPLPLIFNFHDLNQTTDDLEAYTRMADQATRAGFAVVAPIGLQTRWNFTRSAKVGPDDVLFAGSLLNELIGKMCLDSRRIFAAGFADGANMVLTLACALPGRFVAAVTVAASVLPASCGSPTTSMLEIHGTQDPIAPFDGGGDPRPAPFDGVVAQPVQDWMARYASALGCGSNSQTFRDTAAWSRSVWPGCPEGRDVGLLAMQGGGHTWPGAQARPQLGPTSVSFNATVVALTYFGFTPTGATAGGPVAPAAPSGSAAPTRPAPTLSAGVPAPGGGPAATPSAGATDAGPDVSTTPSATATDPVTGG